MPSRSSVAWLCVGLTCGCLAAALAFGASPLHDYIERRVWEAVQEQVVWSPDSPEQVQARFADNSDPSMPPLRARFHFLNITNLAAVRQGAKPELQEVGPYTFQAVKVKRQVEFVRGGDAVRYHEYRYFRPLPELSNGSLSDPITTLNVPLVGAVEVIGSLGVWKARRLLQMLAAWVERWGDPRVQGLFTTRTAGELLFGYEDQLLRQLSRFVSKLNPSFALQPNMTSPDQADAEAPTQANTGLCQLSRVWQTELWCNVSEISSWAPPHLERVRGSDGVQFRPGLALGDSVELWLGEIYRAVPLLAQEEVHQGGVPLLRLRFDPAASDVDPRYYQYVRGLWNITSPTAGGPSGKPGQPGPPIFLSRPHYCDADPSLAAGVHGLNCQPELHESHIDVEPNTGITLGASVKLMMSSWFGRKWSMIDEAVQDTYLPIMWVEIASQATQKQLRQVAPLLWARAAQHFLLTHAHLAAASFAAVAAFCLSLAAVLWSSSEEGIATSGAAGGSGGRGSSDDANGALDAAERAEQREPLLPRSYPVAAEEDGRPAGEESQANGGLDNEPEQQQQQQAQGPGLVGALLQRLRSSPAAPQAPPAAEAPPAAA